MTGIILMLFAYAATAVFLWRVLLRILVVLKKGKSQMEEAAFASRTSPAALLRAIGDIVFLGKLFRVNPMLWFGEWVFHASFLMVVLGHLRFLLEPVPAWVTGIQGAGLIAGYALPVSLLYIFIVKLGIEKVKYFSSYNFFLLLLIFIISMSGLLMRTSLKTDLAGIKGFILSGLAFSPGAVEANGIFIVHFVMVFFLVAYLPSHIFTAPFVIYEARRHDAGLGGIMHEK
jgi:nitrate reductase gamma subunit